MISLCPSSGLGTKGSRDEGLHPGTDRCGGAPHGLFMEPHREDTNVTGGAERRGSAWGFRSLRTGDRVYEMRNEGKTRGG